MSQRIWKPRPIALIATVSLVAITAGCETSDQPAPSVRQRLSRPADDPANQTSATEETAKPRKPGKPVAFVNDKPIERKKLIQLLLETRGLGTLQQLILEELAKQETQRLSLVILPADIDREYDLTLQAARFNGKDPESLTPARREQLIDEWTRTRGVTRQELAIAMTRQTHLRKIAQGQVTIADEMLLQEYERVHGEKVEVRHLQLAAERVWPQIQERLAQGDRFEDLVADFSQNHLSREQRGLLPPFSVNDMTVPAIFAKVAFSLEPGEVSNPIKAEGTLHVLKLERQIPAEDVEFDEVKETLRRHLFARLVAEKMESLGANLLSKCSLKIEDKTLRDRYKKRHAAGKIAGPPLLGQ